MAAVRFFFFLFFLLLIPSLSQSDPAALLKFKNSLTPQNVFADWAAGSEPCRHGWSYVRCSAETGSLIGLNLVNLGLSGPIDVDALLQIPELRSISLENNSFSGPLPPFNKHPALRALYLTNNKFSGEIPNDYFNSSVAFRKVWLNGNQFSGRIPDSLMQMPGLTELHLENNQFSGTLPLLKNPESLTSFDLSNNKLQGQIPESYSRFSASVFAGNAELCGKPLEAECSSGRSVSSSGPNEVPVASGSNSKILTLVALVLIVIAVWALASMKKERVGDFKRLEKEPNDDTVKIHVPEPTRGAPESTRKAATESTRGSKKGGSQQGGRNVMSDLVMVNEEKPSFGMQDLMKAAAEVLGNGSLGSAYKATMASGLSVVVKRVKEMNRLGKEAFDSEMRRMGRLRHPNILTPLSYHFRREEKLIVSEHVAKGSLSYVLHGDRGSMHAELNWPTRLKIVKGIARGLGFIHQQYSTYEVPHGNLKSSNVLLTQNYEPLLNDYAFQPLINPSHVQAFVAYKSPEYVQSQQVSHKSDVYCLGIIILEILTGKFPSQYLSSNNGGFDVVQWVQSLVSENKEGEVIDPAITATSSESINQMVELLRIGVACIESNPNQRLLLQEAIRRIEEVID